MTSSSSSSPVGMTRDASTGRVAYHLTFASSFKPFFFYDTASKAWSGHLVEAWRMLARHDNATVSLKHAGYSSGSSWLEYDGVLGEIRDGAAITAVDASGLTPDRFVFFKYSAPACYASRDFYVRRREAVHEDTELAYFSVYSLWTLSSLLVCAVVCFVIERAIALIIEENKHNHDVISQNHDVISNSHSHDVISSGRSREPYQRSPLSVLSHLAGRVLCTLSLAFVAYFHAAGFRGNSTFVVLPRDVTFKQVTYDLRSGQRQLVARPYEFLQWELDFLLSNKSQPIRAEADVPEELMAVCGDNSLVVRLYENELVYLSELRQHNRQFSECALSKVPVTDVDGVEIPLKLAYIGYIPFTFLLHPNTSRAFHDRVNLMLLSLFDYDKTTFFWPRRFLRKAHLALGANVNPASASIAQDNYDRSAMSLARLRVVFFLFFGALAACFFTAVVEYWFRTAKFCCFSQVYLAVRWHRK